MKAVTGKAYFRANLVKELKDAEEAEFVMWMGTPQSEIDGKVETVHFLLIDTPKTKHPELGKQPMGKEPVISTKTCWRKRNGSHWNMTWRREGQIRSGFGLCLRGRTERAGRAIGKRARPGGVYESSRQLDAFRKAEKFAEGKKLVTGSVRGM